MPDPVKPKGRRGCLFYGCLAGIVCLVAILIAGLLGVHQLKKLLNQYTDTKPITLPQPQLSPSDADQIQKRVNAFRDAVQAGRPTSPLTLTADEINSLIATDPGFQALRGKVYVSLEGDLAKGQISVPLEELGLTRFRGRYLNGTGTFGISLQDGILHVNAEQLAVKGQPLPSTYLDAIRQQNLAAQLNGSPSGSAALKKLQGIRVENGKLVLVPKVEQ